MEERGGEGKREEERGEGREEGSGGKGRRRDGGRRVVKGIKTKKLKMKNIY